MVARLLDDGHLLDEEYGAFSKYTFKSVFLPHLEEDISVSSGPVLLLLHGLSDDKSEWKYDYVTAGATYHLGLLIKRADGESKESLLAASQFSPPHGEDVVNVIFVWQGRASVLSVDMSCTPSGVIGRFGDGDTDERSSVVKSDSARVDFVSGACGEVRVETFDSQDDEDRGGIVLRIRVRDYGSAFIPYARNVPGGVEIHMAGDAEAESLVLALRALLERRRPHADDFQASPVFDSATQE